MAGDGPESELEFLQEAALVVTPRGRVRGANAAARTLLGPSLSEGELSGMVADNAAATEYLRRASRSTASLAGAVTLAPKAGGGRFRALAARLRSGTEGEMLLVLRLLPAAEGRFGALNRQLAAAERILRRRQRENARLKQALAANRELVRELQHRVKNALQQAVTMVKMSAAGREGDEVSDVVAAVSGRLRAMGAAQEALYQVGRTTALSAVDFLGPAVRATAAPFDRDEDLSITVAEGEMTAEEAQCLALVTHELVTNALLHAGPGGPVSITFASADGEHLLEVRDRGPGFEGRPAGRSSGLSLAQALCQQIDATLDIENDCGTRCSVRFRSSLSETEGS